MTKVIKEQSVLSLLRQADYSELAYQFAKYIERQDNNSDALIVLTAALLSEAVSKGHVCLNLVRVGELGMGLDEILPDSVALWVTKLRESHLVGKAGDLTPLVLTDSGLLYLYRYWQAEHQVAVLIRERLKSVALQDETLLKQYIANWTSSQPELDWQKVAVLMALTRQFCVISGGPGTGKTTIVIRLLEAFSNQDKTLRVALAAPTGKAAARMQQAIAMVRQDSSKEDVLAKTVHRLLGITPNNEQGKYNAENPLAVDVLIVDEASMIDILLMSKILKALPKTARLILLGDSKQLASVDSGAVLADLCRAYAGFSECFAEGVLRLTGQALPSVKATSLMADTVVILKHSYRFDKQSEIGQLAQSIQAGDSDKFINVLMRAGDTIWWQKKMDKATIVKRVMKLYFTFFEAIKTQQDPLTCMQLFEKTQVLCALNNGAESVDSVNSLIERALAKQSWRTHQGFYHGRPIMVMKNDYSQGLFNGDTGLVMNNDQGVLAACFLDNRMLRWVPLNRLPAHETAYAMTVHKSQGSEFEEVCIILPEQATALLTRELLYTAMTRAKVKISLIATESILIQAVTSQQDREMGLMMEID
jgi:exodeoxyribonuclease V alpha subunit